MAKPKTQELARRALSQLVRELEAGRSEQLKAYLAALARLHRYSWGNVLLIHAQCPGASRVAGYRTWQRLGRQVRRGAKGIHILAPIVRRARRDQEEEKVVGFRGACVFDVSQTDGEPLPEFARVGGDPGPHLARLKRMIADRGIELERAAIPGGADGLSCAGRIVVRPGLKAAEEFSVLAHELAHTMLHQSDAARPASKQVRETEAEAVTFVVCQAAGLATNSAASDYIQLYQGNRETLIASFERIQRASAEIIKGVLAGEVAKRAPRYVRAAQEHRSLFDFM